MSSTSSNQRAAVAAYKQAHPGISHTAAVRAVRGGWKPLGATRAPAQLDPVSTADSWTAYADRTPAVAVFWRDRDGDGRVDEIAVYDRATGALLSSLVVPHVPADSYLRFTKQQEARGRLSDSRHRRQDELGWPDRMLHRLGHEAFILSNHWTRWSDGSWRVPAEPLRDGETHSVTVTTLDPAAHLVRLVVIEHPDTVVLREDVKVRFDSGDRGPYFLAVQRLLDRRGFAADTRDFEDISPGVEYGLATAGHLPERYWYTRARLRVLREFTSTPPEGRPRTFRAGDIVTMEQSGSAGSRPWTRSWAMNPDLEVAPSLRAEDVEVVEILDHWPPSHAEAALDVDTVTALLAPHHRGAAEAVAAWAAAGLHMAHGSSGLEIALTSPRHRIIGHVPRDYFRKGKPYSKPYRPVRHDIKSPYVRTVELDALPLDPLAAAGIAPRTGPADWTLPTGASYHDRASLVEDLMWRHFPQALTEEILTDDSSLPHGFEHLVTVCRPLVDGDQGTIARVFTEVGQVLTTDQAELDAVLYGTRGAARVLADLLQQRYSEEMNRPRPEDMPPF